MTALDIRLDRPATGRTTEEPSGLRARAPHLVLLAFRLVVGFLFLLHVALAFGAFGGVDGQGGGVPLGSVYWWASIVQGTGAVLVAAGLYTRISGFVLSGVMAFAYFAMHAPAGWNPLLNLGEQAALYSWIFLLLCAIGAGRFSLDAVRLRRRTLRRRVG